MCKYSSSVLCSLLTCVLRRPSRSDCPGYELPVEKKPRRMEQSGEDNYYPSGGRDRRPVLDGPFGRFWL